MQIKSWTDESEYEIWAIQKANEWLEKNDKKFRIIDQKVETLLVDDNHCQTITLFYDEFK